MEGNGSMALARLHKSTRYQELALTKYAEAIDQLQHGWQDKASTLTDDAVLVAVMLLGFYEVSAPSQLLNENVDLYTKMKGLSVIQSPVPYNLDYASGWSQRPFSGTRR